MVSLTLRCIRLLAGLPCPPEPLESVSVVKHILFVRMNVSSHHCAWNVKHMLACLPDSMCLVCVAIYH